jgi:hypothetical protein
MESLGGHHQHLLSGVGLWVAIEHRLAHNPSRQLGEVILGDLDRAHAARFTGDATAPLERRRNSERKA